MRDAFAHCEALVRAADRDRFLATLFAPAEHRDALFALYAFNVEITRVREAAASPWRARSGCNGGATCWAGRAGGRSRPIRWRRALLASMARYRLPRGAFRGADRGAPVRSLRRADGDAADLEAYADGASSGLIAWRRRFSFAAASRISAR